jgi:argininosuccinate synthase
MDRDLDLVHVRDRLAPEVAEMVYYGFSYSAKMDALFAFIREAHKITLGLAIYRLSYGKLKRR